MDHPDYCALCGQGMFRSYSELCGPCEEQQYEEDTDEWGGMSHEERVEFTILNIINGNHSDAMNFITHDGDIRADSLKLIVAVMSDLITHQVRAPQHVADYLIRNIEKWETR